MAKKTAAQKKLGKASARLCKDLKAIHDVGESEHQRLYADGDMAGASESLDMAGAAQADAAKYGCKWAKT